MNRKPRTLWSPSQRWG